MKKSLFFTLLAATLLVFSGTVTAASDSRRSATSTSLDAAEPPMAYVNLNVGIEINGLEELTRTASDSLQQVGESLQKLADNPKLDPEGQQRVQQALQRVDRLGDNLNRVIDRLPATVEHSISPIASASIELSSKVKSIVIVTAIVLVLIILAALAAIYYFVLAPGTQAVIETTALLGDLAETLKTTAEIVDVSSKRNLQLLEEVRTISQAPDPTLSSDPDAV